MAKKKVVEEKTPAEAAPAPEDATKVKKVGEETPAKAAEEKPAKKVAKKAAKKAAKPAKGTETAAEKPAGESKDILEGEVVPGVSETFDQENQLEREMRTAEGAAEAESDIILDRIYTIPLRKSMAAPHNARGKHAVELVKKFIVRHMKPDGGLIITQAVNQRIWEHGIKKPPKRIRIRATKNTEGFVTVALAE
jgi:large subunit ribosomal protein L31e